MDPEGILLSVCLMTVSSLFYPKYMTQECVTSTKDKKENAGYRKQGRKGRHNSPECIWQKYSGSNSRRNIFIYSGHRIHSYNSTRDHYHMNVLLCCSHFSFFIEFIKDVSSLLQPFGCFFPDCFNRTQIIMNVFHGLFPCCKKKWLFCACAYELRLGFGVTGKGQLVWRQEGILSLPNAKSLPPYGDFSPTDNIPSSARLLDLQALSSSNWPFASSDFRTHMRKYIQEIMIAQQCECNRTVHGNKERSWGINTTRRRQRTWKIVPVKGLTNGFLRRIFLYAHWTLLSIKRRRQYTICYCPSSLNYLGGFSPYLGGQVWMMW